MATDAPVFSIDSSRKLKNALQDCLPNVKSSHLSEAIATALGFKTHIALHAAINDGTAPTLNAMRDAQFFDRLTKLGYPGIERFSLAEMIRSNGEKQEFLDLLQRIQVLEVEDVKNYDEINSLRGRAATLFGKAYGLGYLGSAYMDDLPDGVIKRFTQGVDHTAPAGWGDLINIRHPLLEFPHTDHRFRFYQQLPLANGKFVEYSSAMVSMPYKDRQRGPHSKLSEQGYAEKVGWQFSEDDNSSWYMKGATHLHLFRRATSHQEILRLWHRSFKRWLMENKPRLLKSVRGDRRMVINDAFDCQHLPLHVQSWEELCESYFKEFVPILYLSAGDGRTKAFKRLFEQWRDEVAE